jgi:glycoside hydrolase-like protein
MSLAVYDRGIDYAGARPDPADVAKNGGKFILRYSAGAASATSHPSYDDVKWKLCGPGEIAAAVKAGLDFIANSEWYQSRVTEGASAGKADGTADLAFWKSRGLAKGASIYVSWDEGQPATGKHGALAAYLTAYEKALGGYYRADLYAGDVALAAMLAKELIRYGWRAEADSWSADGSYYKPGTTWKTVAAKVATVSPAHIWQDGNTWYSNGADEDVILRLPVGSHLEALQGDDPVSDGKSTNATTKAVWGNRFIETGNPDHPYETAGTSMKRIRDAMEAQATTLTTMAADLAAIKAKLGA